MKSPRQHQISALEATRINNKGIINLPTGTGKSYIQSLNIIDNINKSKVFVVISPRILLADQLLEEIRKDLEENLKDCHYLVVHSGLGNYEREDLKILADLKRSGLNFREVKSTTNTSVIIEEYNKAINENVPLIISCTYHSAERLMQSKIPIDITYCDEAHYLLQEDFNWVATDEFISKKKYFFTATLKETVSDKSRGMNNKEIYGEIISQKKPIEMIHAGEILRPRMHLVDIEEYHTENEINNSVNAIISSFEAHRKECKIGAKMLVNTKGSEEQNEIINHPQIVEFLKNNPKVKIFDITSENGPRIKYYNNPNPKDTVKRSDFFKQLREMKDEEEVIILHIRILTEGIDVPGITGVMLMNNPTLSSFLQSLGRATRLHKIDRNKLYSGEIKSNELEKFIKPYAYVIVPKYGLLGN